MQVALIDHYDSFTFNVIDWLAGRPGDPDGELDVLYVGRDDVQALVRLRDSPRPLVLSPGPKRPEDAPATLALARALLGVVPLFGVCLGHQMLGLLAGGEVVPSAAPWHGTTREVRRTGDSAQLAGLPACFRAAVYHSLVVAPGGLGDGWRVTALCELGEVQALERLVPGEAPAFGVQFHPESFLSEGAAALRRNWLQALRAWEAGQSSAIAPLPMPS